MVQQQKQESPKPEKRMVQKVVQWCSYENKENALTEATISVRAQDLRWLHLKSSLVPYKNNIDNHQLLHGLQNVFSSSRKPS